jgi:hypothetical protein
MGNAALWQSRGAPPSSQAIGWRVAKGQSPFSKYAETTTAHLTDRNREFSRNQSMFIDAIDGTFGA